jgi:hypothetical protein
MRRRVDPPRQPRDDAKARFAQALDLGLTVRLGLWRLRHNTAAMCKWCYLVALLSATEPPSRFIVW